MNDKDKQLLKEFIQYKDDNSPKYIVINKDNVSMTRNNSDGTIDIRLQSFPSRDTYYEFGGNTVVGMVMELFKKAYGRDEYND